MSERVTEHSVTKIPTTKVVIEFVLDHPLWRGDGRDETIALDALLGQLPKMPDESYYTVTSVETS
jgi:hypothetical protein